MGILGLLAYFALLIATARLAWRVWRERSRADLQGVRARVAVRGRRAAGAETTATFTAAELRFTIVFATQIGLLALIMVLPQAEGGRPKAGAEPAAAAPALPVRSGAARAAPPLLRREHPGERLDRVALQRELAAARADLGAPLRQQRDQRLGERVAAVGQQAVARRRVTSSPAAARGVATTGRP